MNSRLVSIIRKEFIQIMRDKRTLVIILIIPIMQLFLLGYSATNDIRNIPMAVVDQCQCAESRELLDAYRAADYFKLEYTAASEEQLRGLIETGKVKVGMIIPPDYNTRLAEGQAQVAFILDGSDATAGSTALSAATLIGQAHATDLMIERLSRSGIDTSRLQPPLEVRTRVWYNPDLVSSYFMIPGVIGMILFAITSILTATSVVTGARARHDRAADRHPHPPVGTDHRQDHPLRPAGFHRHLRGARARQLVVRRTRARRPGLIIFCSGLLLLSGLGIGLFASTIANTQQEAMLITWMTLLPSIFLSGFFFPLEAMPLVLQWISYIIPLRYYLVIIRALLIKGVGMSAIWQETLALALFGLVIMAAASLRFRKRLD